MSDAEWNDPATDTLVMALSGELFTRDEDGYPMRDSAYLVALNRADSAVSLTLPATPDGDSYRRLLDTDPPRPITEGPTVRAGEVTSLAPRSVALFRVENTH